MKLYGESVVAKRTVLGVTCVLPLKVEEGTPRIVSFSVSALAVVASKVETATPPGGGRAHDHAGGLTVVSTTYIS